MWGGGGTKNAAISYPGLIAIPPGWTGIVLVPLSLQYQKKMNCKSLIYLLYFHVDGHICSMTESLVPNLAAEIAAKQARVSVHVYTRYVSMCMHVYTVQ